MNERIKLLAEQCYEDNSTQIDVYKFAELIVTKCADVAKRWTPETEECEYTWLIHDKIKEHFGVEK